MKRIMSSDGFFSDIIDEDILDNYTLDTDEFFFCYSDQILDIYYEFKERFTSSPFFFSYLTYPILSDFIHQLIVQRNLQLTKTYNLNNLNDFDHFYSVEIEYSYNILNTFLRKFKFSLTRNLFIQFCILYSDLHELKNSRSY